MPAAVIARLGAGLDPVACCCWWPHPASRCRYCRRRTEGRRGRPGLRRSWRSRSCRPRSPQRLGPPRRDAREDLAFLGGARLVPGGDLLDRAQAAAARPRRRVHQADADAGRDRRAARPRRRRSRAACGGSMRSASRCAAASPCRRDRIGPVRDPVVDRLGLGRGVADAGRLDRDPIRVVARRTAQIRTVSPSKVVNSAVATSLSGTGRSAAGLTSSRSSAVERGGRRGERRVALELGRRRARRRR